MSRGAPVGSECRELAHRERPGLEAAASRLLRDDSDVYAWADCDSGGYAAVDVGLREPSSAVVRRMRRLGDAERVTNTTECVEYLPASQCDRRWRYTPHGSEQTYIVEMPPDGDKGEFAMGLDH